MPLSFVQQVHMNYINSKPPSNYTMTNNPNLWCNTYWGGGRSCTSSTPASKQIIKNRNEFYNEFNGLKHYKTTTRLEKHFHNNIELRPDYMNGERKPSYSMLTDHTEYYINKNKSISNK